MQVTQKWHLGTRGVQSFSENDTSQNDESGKTESKDFEQQEPTSRLAIENNCMQAFLSLQNSLEYEKKVSDYVGSRRSQNAKTKSNFAFINAGLVHTRKAPHDSSSNFNRGGYSKSRVV